LGKNNSKCAIDLAVSTKNRYNDGMTLEQIDVLCDEFEAALRRGDTVLIHDVLPKVEESQRSALLEELLEIKIQFAVETKQSDDYIRSMLGTFDKQFPEQKELIQFLLRRANQLRQVGDYEILGELGRGGMGIVYKAKHKLLQQTVAIKVLSQTLIDDSQAVGRFKREMQLIGGLTHPNIVRALNAGDIDGTLYLAMEFVDGVSLQKLVENVRTKNNASAVIPTPLISLGAACEMIRQAALGLQNSHELKLVHRDIKPANLMLDHHGTVKILDLGLGKFAEECRSEYHSSLTMEGMVVGTVDYISPEQCENSREADIRSDLYSLGCTLYFLLTGKPVYSGSRFDTMRKKLMAHIVGEVPSLRAVIPNIPLAVEKILQKVLAKDPAERFQTPLEFAEALAPFASPDELWTLTQEVIPMDASDSRTNMRHSSPYGYVQSSRQSITPPLMSRIKWMAFFVTLNLLVLGIGVAAAFYFYTSYQQEQIYALRKKASQAAQNATQHWEQWRMEEAQAEYQRAARFAMEDFAKTKADYLPAVITENWFLAATAQWYHGDSTRARQELQFRLNRVNDNISELDATSGHPLLGYKKRILERLGDFVLFGGAASGRNRERFANGIARYEDATKVPTMNSYDATIRWKQAILLMQNGELDRAETLMRENSKRSGKTPDLYQQLAEAVLHYYQNENSADRTQKLRTFRGQFSSQDSPMRGSAGQPEIVELLQFCSEFLVNDSLKHEDWETLAADILSMRHGTANFVRQYPGAIPFMRRFYEVLLQSAALVYENTDRQRDKQAQIENIVRLLERMRPLTTESDTVGTERPTLVLFFLPGTMTEPGFVVFYPQDGRTGALYRLPLTRQHIKQRREPATVLPEQLLEKITAERRIRVSWTDTAAWARAEDALSEAEYPYGDVLPY